MVEFDWPEYVAGAEIVVVLRFSFYGRSGWKSDFSRDMDQLFDEDRLALRLQLLSAFPLASLTAQTDQNFHLFVLTSNLMPDWAMKSLRQACRDALPTDRFTIAGQSPGLAGEYLRRFLKARSGDKPAFHVILDDDDALACDFMARLRPKMATLSAPGPEDIRFVSFSRGYALDLSDMGAMNLRMYRHQYPFINLGLAMVGPPRGANVLTIAHRRGPRKHEHALVAHGKRMFVRGVHGGNDSRVGIGEKWAEVEDWRRDPDIRKRFGYLLTL